MKPFPPLFSLKDPLFSGNRPNFPFERLRWHHLHIPGHTKNFWRSAFTVKFGLFFSRHTKFRRNFECGRRHLTSRREITYMNLYDSVKLKNRQPRSGLFPMSRVLNGVSLIWLFSRSGTVNDIAQVAVFLSSPAASFIR